ncbi:hypothetical protein BDN70DRAFT_886822 [Pholiota conissans]|uniref:Uncharacterized protein n=1 Tax=Pholiota conissans TaxID=109636 RepID=A0A9P5YQ18_9AGAR|nr:hypothetical protein BDN70DRAFT_886822 [Pholiota conissans]
MDPSTATGSGDHSSSLVTSEGSSDTLATICVTIGTLVLFLWEVASRTRSDIRTLRSFKSRRLQSYNYSLSRIVTFAYMVTTLIFQAAPLGSCKETLNAANVLYLISVSLTALLLIYRIRTVFLNDKYISTIFGFLCLCVVGGCTTLFPGFTGMASKTSAKHCTISPAIPPYVSAFLIGHLLDTSLVFIFIAARLVERCKMDVGTSHGVGKFVKANFTTVISTGLLQEGQGLYLSTVLLQLVTLILFLLGSSITARVIILPLNLAIFNAAACRVYISSQARKFEEESARRTKIILSLGIAAHHRENSLPYLGGVKITQTVETFQEP